MTDNYSTRKIFYLREKSYLTAKHSKNAENRTVSKSLPLFLKYFVKCLFLKRLCQTVENLK